jgi:hypothetical protein
MRTDYDGGGESDAKSITPCHMSKLLSFRLFRGKIILLVRFDIENFTKQWRWELHVFFKKGYSNPGIASFKWKNSQV